MKKICSILLSLLLCAAISVTALPLTASASSAHRLSLKIKENEDGQTVVAVILPEADGLEVIDFTFSVNSDMAKIKKISTKGTDTEKILINLDKKYDKKKTFTYTTTKAADNITFSGFFIDSLTTDDSFHICNIILEKDGKFTKADTFTLSYSIKSSAATDSGIVTFYPSTKKQNTSYVNSANPMGDVNLDGKVTSYDARQILRVSVGLDTLSLQETPYADTDYDGAITSGDARNALRMAVDLEEIVMHRFIIILDEENKSCKKGGTYTFFCELTGKTISMEIKNGGHICPDTGCYNTGRCIICDKKINDATDHTYDEDGSCTVCGADKKEIKKIKNKLLPLIEEVRTYDLLADESLSNYKKADFLSFSQDAALSLRKAAEICDGQKGFEDIADKLKKAYKVRFNAFLSCMDENGEILSDTANCTTIQNAVHFSYVYINPLSYLK